MIAAIVPIVMKRVRIGWRGRISRSCVLRLEMFYGIWIRWFE